jgi:hypothetical protein
MADATLLRAKLLLPAEFRIDEVKTIVDAPPTPTPPLGVLENFTGEFSGTGFNTIFRPNGAAPTTTTFTNPIPPPPILTAPNENVLELNLTTETLTFSAPLGSVPNRGLGMPVAANGNAQEDIFFNAVPYVQAVSDVTNQATGKGDGKPQAIHFEPGIWLNVPATKNVPVLANSLVRMASIPHGTTINAQGSAPTTVNGPPNIPSVSITPFVIGSSPPHLITFTSQTAANKDTPRIPQDLTHFIASGEINQAILTDPNTVLRNAIAGQTITKTIFFTVSTTPPPPEFGGGTANIAFLEGNAAATSANANAVRMTATFWIETVEHLIPIPVFKPGQGPLRIPVRPGVNGPVFTGTPPREIPSPIAIKVFSTQIQYSQVVFLNFAGLTWPHVSVATLTPAEDLPIPVTAWP